MCRFSIDAHHARITFNFTLEAGGWIVTQDPVDGLEQWVGLASAPIAEVVQIQSPDHCSADAHRVDEF